jgi:asparagine synthase (glutamine-hydrolysing)
VCGIAGWVGFDEDLAERANLVEAMAATMDCRGPDGQGLWSGSHAVLGHRRLAVIDIPGGKQPMTVGPPGAEVRIVYSGEVYNFVELRRELRGLGHRFRTESDTEVVARAYLEWGDALADRLGGMYAFAIWDARAERLLLVRDRLGVKPLYYYRVPGGVLFASEPKAILAHPMSTRVVGLDGLRRMLAYAKTIPGVVWEGMSEVEPGTTVVVDRRGLREQVYWRLAARPHDDDLPTTVATVRDLLNDTVRRQLVADVPRCVLLSGGLDSSALTALAAAELAGDLRTYSVDFEGYAEDFVPDEERTGHDAPYVREVARHLGLRHRELMLDSMVLADLELRRRVVEAYDVPPGSGDRDRWLYLLFQAIREHAVVAVSGESADELFGGYHWFHDARVRRVPMFPWITALSSAYGLPREALVPDLAGRLDLDGYVAERYDVAAREVERLESESVDEHRMRVVSALHLTTHLRVLLDRKDRLSMATGLEVRVPYCDHRLVEYVYNAPWAMKAFDHREKSLLRAAVGDLLPRSVLDRRKSAGPSVQDPRFVAALQSQAKELVAAASHPVFEIIDRRWLEDSASWDPVRTPAHVRNGIEWTLNLATWLELYRPGLRIP